MRDMVYDLETYKSCFSATFLDMKTGQIRVFEISPWKNEWTDLRHFVKKCSDNFVRWVGFNNYNFDYPVMHFMLQNFKLGNFNGADLALQAHLKGTRLIKCSKEEKFSQIIWDNNQIIPQIDLFKIHHFDNMAKATSLKVLEFNMRSEQVEDLPFDPAVPLKEEQKNIVLEYNIHDVEQTAEFYKHSMDMVRFREELSEKYDKNFLNHNDTKIGKDFFIMELEKVGVSCYKYDEDGRKPVQTERPSIRIADLIFPYVKFDRPEFNAVADWLKQQTITETKGVFTDIPDFEVLDRYIDIDSVKFKKKTKAGKVQAKTAKTYKFPKHLKSTPEKLEYLRETYQDVTLTNLNCIANGFQFDFGTGGIHGSVESTIISECDDFAIIDYDVTSLYPSIGIVNEVFPKHLTRKFCPVYAQLKKDRMSYKKGTPENAMLKLALNGVYGDSNNKFSPFYDPQYTMTITINGQLMLCMLAEKYLKIDGLKILQVNTDGITVKVPRGRIDDVEQANTEWSELTKLDLERADYSRMFIRDCNNYIGEYTDGKLKRKGAYEWDALYRPDHPDFASIQWHKNHSAMVVKRAAEELLVNGKSIKDYIQNHDDVYDFMLRTKVPRSSKLLCGDDQIQNTTRYYVSKSGGQLLKIMPPLKKNPEKERPIKIHDGWGAKPVNDMAKYPDQSVILADINHDYYIEQANKLVESLHHGLLSEMFA